MELLHSILDKGISLGATDIHLAPGQTPVFRVKKKLFFDQTRLALSDISLEEILNFFYKRFPALSSNFKIKKQIDFSYTYSEHRFRINISLTKGLPTFSMRVIPNGDIDVNSMGLRQIIERMKSISNGLILVTGKVNSGKSTTMNGFVQEVNRESNKKIVTLEDPVEYEHVSDKSIIIQKEIGAESDVVSFHDGLINLLREDADIAVLGEIRDKETMDVAIDLAESGGLVIGTLHTRSCGETVERIISMYSPSDQQTIKNAVSSVLKMVVSQKLVVSTKGELLMVPEVMLVNNTIAAQMRQEKFNVSDIEDTIHSQREKGCLSFENSFADLYLKGLIDIATVKANVDPDRFQIIKSIIIGEGGSLSD
ncbi:MAG: ATPase, T2SS/T4P/T4SS family [Clostridia bacterium]